MNNPAGLHLRIAKECPNYGVHFTASRLACALAAQPPVRYMNF